MFLVKDSRHGATYLVFTWEDPRQWGFDGHVEEDVQLDYDLFTVHRWPDGSGQPEACAGRNPDDSKHFKVFRNNAERDSEGYQPEDGAPVVLGSWMDYLKLFHPEDLPDEEWYRQLDRYDEASRLRRQRAEMPAQPTSGSRDEVAAWVARKHLIADSAIREVWYLPREAPPEEIRLLELNDRLAGAESKTEAIDFGLDVEGARFRLFVADVTSDELDQIKRDPSRLPPGWSLDDKRTWRRGA